MNDFGNELRQIDYKPQQYQNTNPIDAVHIVTLGEKGQISFANTEVNSHTISQYAGILKSWRDSLDADADILLYGCDIARGCGSNSFLKRFSRLTGADVLASNNKTGFFGDWELETAVGKIESGLIFQPSIQEVYLETLDSGEISITPGDLPDFNNVDFSSTRFDFSRVAADDLVFFANAGLNFDTVRTGAISNIDFASVPVEDLSILTDEGLSLSEFTPQRISEIDYTNIPAENLRILTNSGGLKFDTLASEKIDNINFQTIPAENLQILADSGLNFQRLEGEDFQDIDINSVPPENIRIMANSGLDLRSYDSQTVAEVTLSVVQNFGYISPDSLSVFSIGDNTTFGGLSELVTANANLFEYRGESIDLSDGFSIAEAEVLDPNDYKALDFAFTGDEIFDSFYYYERNPDVADEGTNPFTQYFNSGAFAPEYRDPSAYFDSSYYLQRYTDVADDGINPLFQYFNSGASAPEFRDPDAAFDTSFYLEEYSEVIESGTNPLLDYVQSGASEGRFANETFKTFEETGEAIVLSPQISVADYEIFEDFAFSVIETGGTETAGLIIPIVVGGIKVIGIGLLSLEILNRVDNIQQLIDRGSVDLLWYPDNEEVFIEDNLEQFPLPGAEEIGTGTPPFDVGNVIGFDDNVFFPKDGFLESISSGQFEFPYEGEGSSYFLAIEENNEILQDVLDNSTLEGKGKSARYRYNSGGGFTKANEIFNSLNPSNVRTVPDGKGGTLRVGTLDDGRNINVREASSEGSPTLEIQRRTASGKTRRTKIRFDSDN